MQLLQKTPRDRGFVKLDLLGLLIANTFPLTLQQSAFAGIEHLHCVPVASHSCSLLSHLSPVNLATTSDPFGGSRWWS